MPISKYIPLLIFVTLNLLINADSNAQNVKLSATKKELSRLLPTSIEKYIDDNNDAHLKEYF